MLHHKTVTAADPQHKLLMPLVHEESTGIDLIDNLDDDCLAKIFQFLPIADKLNIEGVCKRWKTISPLAWENVKSLDLIQDFPFAPTDLGKLPLGWRNTRGIIRILKKCGRYLNHLLFGPPCNWKIPPAVGYYCENLISLEIDCDFENWWWSAFFPRLQKFKLVGLLSRRGCLPANIFQALPPGLIEIDITACDPGFSSDLDCEYLPDAALTVFSKFTKIAKIHLFNVDLEPDLINTISQKSTLTSLSINSCLIERLPRLTLLTNLEHLDLSATQEANDTFLIELAETCKNLKSLVLYECNVNDRGISSLEKLPKLEELRFSEFKNVTDSSLSRLHSLKKLNCDTCPRIRDEGIITLLKYAPMLKYLNVERTAVTQKVLAEANAIVKGRTNNLSLRVLVSNHVKGAWESNSISPLLILEPELVYYY